MARRTGGPCVQCGRTVASIKGQDWMCRLCMRDPGRARLDAGDRLSTAARELRAARQRQAQAEAVFRQAVTVAVASGMSERVAAMLAQVHPATIRHALDESA